MSSNAAQPIVGTSAVFQVQPPNPTDGSVGSAWITIKNSDYSIKPKSDVKEAPNTTDGMLRSQGLRDYELTVKGHTDVSGTAQANAPESNIMPGSTLDFRAYRSYTGSTPTGPYWQGRMIVMTLDITTGTGNTDDWDMAGAKQSGNLTLPNTTQW